MCFETTFEILHYQWSHLHPCFIHSSFLLNSTDQVFKYSQICNLKTKFLSDLTISTKKLMVMWRIQLEINFTQTYQKLKMYLAKFFFCFPLFFKALFESFFIIHFKINVFIVIGSFSCPCRNILYYSAKFRKYLINQFEHLRFYL